MMKSKRDINSKSPLRRTNCNVISRPRSRLQRAPMITSSTVSSESANIRVVVRVRPPNQKESADNFRTVVKIVDENLLIFDPKENAEPFFYHGVQQKGRDLLRRTQKDLQFVFNRVFGQNVQNAEVFDNSTKPLINALMDGINCSVFAYGATGAGKTHTMLGSPSNPGITFLTMEQLFQTKEELTRERDFELGITYLEVYNEIVQDLLNPGSTLQLREDAKFGVVVAGIKYVNIGSPNELYSLLEQGNKNRTQHPTDANAESSRSHAVFQVYLKMKFKVSGEIRMAKLSMIDLAGSERGSATGFNGARFTEGANINKSLLALGNCINSLADGQRHVPYRDSKLTRLLKDSLGGNCQTVMIANISPSSMCYEDTYNTLKYATRAKAIKASIKRNVVNVELKVEHYAKIVEELNRELARSKAESKESSKELERLKAESKESNRELERLKAVIKELRGKHSEPDVDVVIHKPEISEELQEILNKRRELIEKIYLMEIREQSMQLRRQVKEDANSRLSGLCFDTPEKEQRHKKLDNIIYRSRKQQETYKDELDNLYAEKTNLENMTRSLVEKNPSMKLFVDNREMELAKLASDFETQLCNKRSKIYQDEFQQCVDLIEKMSSVLKPCFLQLRGMGFASENLIKDYEAIKNHSQGVKNLKWEDMEENPVSDSGVCSTTTINTDVPDSPESPMTPERKPVADLTFCINTPISNKKSTKTTTPASLKASKKLKSCADQVMIKAHKTTSASAKKLGKIGGSFRMKENVQHRPIQRFQLRKGLESSSVNSDKHYPLSSSSSSKPPFRR